MPAVIITGGTGLIGKNLTRHLVNKGYHVIVVSRTPHALYQHPLITYAKWNVREQKIDTDAIAKADYIINLAGAGVMDKKWTEKYKKEIVESRTKSGDLIIRSLQQIPNKVKSVISSSAIGWYGEDDKSPIHKDGFIESDPPANNFLGETCRQWEAAIEPTTTLNKRLTILRTGIVLSNDGGAFTEFKQSLRFGIAAVLGSGKQMISWIHMDDLCRMFMYAIENENVSGIYNAVAPSPVNNKKLMIQLAKCARGQFYIPIHIPNFLLKIILGKRSIEILKSTTANCEKIKAAGFTFLYPSISSAIKQLTQN